MKPIELEVYEITGKVVRFAQQETDAAEKDAEMARSIVKALSAAIEKAKKAGQSTGKLQSSLDAAISDSRYIFDRLAVCVQALSMAKRAQTDAHTNLIKGRVTVVSQGYKSVQVIIRVGNQSVTRHLQPSREGYTGWAWDKTDIMSYPRAALESAA